MTSDPQPSAESHPYRSDTNRTAPKRLLMFIIPLALVALAILLVAMKHIGHVM